MLRSGLCSSLWPCCSRGRAVLLTAQLPSNSRFGNGQTDAALAPIPEKGEPIAPFFEGWFREPGRQLHVQLSASSISAGTRPTTSRIGPDNYIEPAEFDGVQPTHFPGAIRGATAVCSRSPSPPPGKQSQERVVWTITANGVTHSVPARVGYNAPPARLRSQGDGIRAAGGSLLGGRRGRRRAWTGVWSDRTGPPRAG